MSAFFPSRFAFFDQNFVILNVQLCSTLIKHFILFFSDSYRKQAGVNVLVLIKCQNNQINQISGDKGVPK